MSSQTISTEEAAARSATAQGNRDQARLHWLNVLQLSPAHSEALNSVGNWHLARQEFPEAIRFLRAAVEAKNNQPAILFNLGMALSGAGLLSEAIASFDAALALDAYFVQALFQKAVALERTGEISGAAILFRQFLDCIPPEAKAAPALETAIEYARKVVSSDGRRLFELIQSKLSTDALSDRVAESVSVLTGQVDVKLQKPTFLLVTRLPAVPYFDRADMPWLADLEQASDTILEELQAILEPENNGSLEPYVARTPGTPLNQWEELNNSPRWSAYHLWKNGIRNEAHCERCPATTRIIESLPRIFVANRAPNAFFSILKAGTRIPPHTGVTNLRSTIHLGLIIPEGCGFRVGNDTRYWKKGMAWAFDDSIEHEAWNESEEDRVILIIDSWNPLVDESERAALSVIHDLYDAHFGHRRTLET